MYGNTCFNDTYHILWTNLFIHFTISYLRLVWIKTPLEALPLASFFFLPFNLHPSKQGQGSKTPKGALSLNRSIY